MPHTTRRYDLADGIIAVILEYYRHHVVVTLRVYSRNDRSRHAETHRIVQYWESRADLLETARNALAGVGKRNRVFAPYKRAALAQLQEMIDEIQATGE